jgi:hypothetical protein
MSGLRLKMTNRRNRPIIDCDGKEFQDNIFYPSFDFILKYRTTLQRIPLNLNHNPDK